MVKAAQLGLKEQSSIPGEYVLVCNLPQSSMRRNTNVQIFPTPHPLTEAPLNQIVIFMLEMDCIATMPWVFALPALSLRAIRAISERCTPDPRLVYRTNHRFFPPLPAPSPLLITIHRSAANPQAYTDTLNLAQPDKDNRRANSLEKNNARSSFVGRLRVQFHHRVSTPILQVALWRLVRGIWTNGREGRWVGMRSWWMEGVDCGGLNRDVVGM